MKLLLWWRNDSKFLFMRILEDLNTEYVISIHLLINESYREEYFCQQPGKYH